MQKINNFINAEKRLAEAILEYSKNQKNTLLRDGLIQRFEFTFELSWKALKEHMLDEGVDISTVQFPKQVLKTAYQMHLIDGEEVWLAMLSARNSTSHIYDDAIADRIGKEICTIFSVPLQGLAQYFAQKS